MITGIRLPLTLCRQPMITLVCVLCLCLLSHRIVLRCSSTPPCTSPQRPFRTFSTLISSGLVSDSLGNLYSPKNCARRVTPRAMNQASRKQIGIWGELITASRSLSTASTSRRATPGRGLEKDRESELQVWVPAATFPPRSTRSSFQRSLTQLLNPYHRLPKPHGPPPLLPR